MHFSKPRLRFVGLNTIQSHPIFKPKVFILGSFFFLFFFFFFFFPLILLYVEVSYENFNKGKNFFSQNSAREPLRAAGAGGRSVGGTLEKFLRGGTPRRGVSPPTPPQKYRKNKISAIYFSISHCVHNLS